MKLTRRKLLRFGLYAGIAGVGAVTYACQIETRWIAYQQRMLAIPKLPESLIGKKCIQLSDLHIGKRVPRDYLLNQFEYVQSLKPDLVVYTGDFVDQANDEHIGLLKEFTEKLPKGTFGTAGILGNHDAYYEKTPYKAERADRVADWLEDGGISVLRNESVEFAGLTIGGLRDYWSPKFRPQAAREVIESLPESSIVLSHNPDSADAGIWSGYQSWILCGHTHGGQCRLPFIGAPFAPVQNRIYIAGEYDLGNGRKMYINRGVGHTVKARINSRPEITIFDLQRA